MFRKVLERYRFGPVGFIREALAEPAARGVAEGPLRGILRLLCDPSNPGGCLVVQGALDCGTEADPIRRELAGGRERAVAAIRERLERALSLGDLPRGSDCAAPARYPATIMHGLAEPAAGGASPEELRRVVDLALRAWPR